MEKNNDAVSPVISAILALLIVSSTMATVLVWGVPYINQLNTTTSIENSAKQFASVIDSIGDLINSNPNESRIDTLSIDKGEVSAGTGEGEKDRTVITYSYDDDHNFSVSKFDTCFLTGTKVLMADRSYKNIEEMNIGDMVLSYDERTRKIVPCKVAKVFSHSPREMADYYLLINDGLRVTPNHRFYSDGKWVYAGNLKMGDLLFSQDRNSNYQVYSVKKIYEREQSFDLEVENCHTYFVSVPYDGVDVLVHNGDTEPGGEEIPGVPSWSVDAGGPYFGYKDTQVTFHVTHNCPSCNCGEGSYIWIGWDFDNDGDYDDGMWDGETYSWSTAGTYTIGVQVYCICHQEDAKTDTAIVYIYIPLILPSAADTYIMEDSPDNNYGLSSELHVDSQHFPFLNRLQHTLIRFDLPNSLSGSTITSAKLRLYYYDYSNNPKNNWLDCYRLLYNWTERQSGSNPGSYFANWIYRLHELGENKAWGNPGGDFASSYTGTFKMPQNSGQWIEWNVKSDVQSFSDGSYPNFGWLLRYSESNTAVSYLTYFYSKEYSAHPELRPGLQIQYLKTETLDATNVKKYNENFAKATLNGNVISDGDMGCKYGFYYKVSGGSSLSWWSTSTKGAGEPFSQTMGSLTPGRLYTYRASIMNSSTGLKNNGSDMFFLTPSNITGFKAKVVSPGQINLNWTLKTGTMGAFINCTGPNSTFNDYVQGTTKQITGLNPESTYTFQAKAYAQDDVWRSDGSQNAPWGNIMTASNTTTRAPYLLTNDATLVHSRDATLNGYIRNTSKGEHCKVWFEYGLTRACGTSTAYKWMNKTGYFNTTISGLKPNTKYYFRAVYQNLSYVYKDGIRDFPTILGGIEIVSPQYGDNWKRGTTHIIEWFYGPQVTGTVYIALYGGPKGNVLSIANVSIDNNGGNGVGSYNWGIRSDQSVGKFNYRIKITSNFDPSIYDYSDYFSIKELHEGTVWNETISPLQVNPQGNVVVSLSCGGSFNLTMMEGSVDKAEVYWLYYGGELDHCSFSGAVQIDLYESGSCFGTIIILDSDSLTYKSQSDSGSYSTTIENGGLLYSDTNTNKYLQKAPPIYEGKHTFSMHAVQLVASPFGAGGTGGFKIRMKTIVNINSVRETDYVYNLRLQFYGDNAEAWLEYFESNYDFEKQQSQPYHTPDTLFYKPSTSKLWFTFAHSAIGVSLQ